MAAILGLLLSCGAPGDQGLADMVEWSDGCCRAAWECAIAALEPSRIGQDPDFRLRPPDEPYRAGARQPFLAESALRVVDVEWTEGSVTYRVFGQFVTHPLPCVSGSVGPLP